MTLNRLVYLLRHQIVPSLYHYNFFCLLLSSNVANQNNNDLTDRRTEQTNRNLCESSRFVDRTSNENDLGSPSSFFNNNNSSSTGLPCHNQSNWPDALLSTTVNWSRGEIGSERSRDFESFSEAADPLHLVVEGGNHSAKYIEEEEKFRFFFAFPFVAIRPFLFLPLTGHYDDDDDDDKNNDRDQHFLTKVDQTFKESISHDTVRTGPEPICSTFCCDDIFSAVATTAPSCRLLIFRRRLRDDGGDEEGEPQSLLLSLSPLVFLPALELTIDVSIVPLASTNTPSSWDVTEECCWPGWSLFIVSIWLVFFWPIFLW